MIEPQKIHSVTKPPFKATVMWSTGDLPMTLVKDVHLLFYKKQEKKV